MQPPNTVVEGGISGPRCGECARALPVAGEFARVCLQCHPHYEFAGLLDESELSFLKQTTAKGDTSAKAVIKRWLRIGQMVDKHMSENPDATVGYLDDQGDFNLLFYDSEPKKAPMPRRSHDNSTYDETLVHGGPEPPHVNPICTDPNCDFTQMYGEHIHEVSGRPKGDHASKS